MDKTVTLTHNESIVLRCLLLTRRDTLEKETAALALDGCQGGTLELMGRSMTMLDRMIAKFPAGNLI